MIPSTPSARVAATLSRSLVFHAHTRNPVLVEMPNEVRDRSAPAMLNHRRSERERLLDGDLVRLDAVLGQTLGGK